MEFAGLPVDEREVLWERLGNFPAIGWSIAVMGEPKDMPPPGFTAL